jgi:hypothetical protein
MTNVAAPDQQITFTAPTRDFEIDLTEHSEVWLVGLTIPGNLRVQNADIQMDHCVVGGSADLTTDGLVDDWAEVFDSQIQGGFQLHAGSGHFYLEGSTFFGDVDVTTANHGPISVNLEQAHFLQNLKLDTNDANSNYFTPDSYQLFISQVVVLGDAELHNSFSPGAYVAYPYYGTTLPFPGMDLENDDFLGNLEIEVDAEIGTIQLNHVHVACGYSMDVNANVDRFDVQSCNFHGGISMDTHNDETAIFQLHMEDSSVDWNATLKTAQTPLQWGPIIAFIVPTGTEVDIVNCSFNHGLDLTTSIGNDDVQLDGSNFVGDVHINLDDGDDTVRVANCTFANQLHVDGGTGTNFLVDQGGNTFAGLDLNSITLQATASTATVSGGLQAVLSTQGPWVESYTPSANKLRLLFNEPIEPSSFTPAQVTLTGDGGVAIPVTGIHVVPGSNYRSFDITFQPTATGGYRAVIGPGIRDLYYGNAMDQNHNGVNGEASDTFQVGDLAGPRVLWSAPAPWHIRVGFSESIDPATFTTADVVLTDLKGHAVAVKAVRAVADSGNTEFDLDVAAFPAGGYRLTVGPMVADQFGNWMDQNQNGIKGARNDSYTVTYVDNTPPAFEGVTGTWVGSGITVTFNGPINPGTFTAAAVSLINEANGAAVAVTGIAVVPYTEGRSFDIDFNALPAGRYLLSLNSAITDLFGNHLPGTGPVTFQVSPNPALGVPLSAGSLARAVFDARGLAGIDPMDPAAETAMLLSVAQGSPSGQPLVPADLGHEATVVPVLAGSLQTSASLTAPKQILASDGGWQGDALATAMNPIAGEGRPTAARTGISRNSVMNGLGAPM